MLDVVMGYLLGLLHGMRHALEPDHVAAVTTMIADQRSARSTVRFAVAWGTGHAITLLVVGGLLFVLRREMPPRLGDVFELVVCVMLVALGVRALALAIRARKGAAPVPHHHSHGHHPHGPGVAHAHVAGVGVGVAAAAPMSTWASARRPLVVGLVHGLAGSGAITAMVMSELPTALAGFVFMALYGVGATCGMAALAGVAGVSLARLAQMPRVIPALMGATGLFSMALGVVWASPVLVRLVAG